MATLEIVAPDIIVDRGNPVIVIVTFWDGDANEVYFSYTQPSSERPYVDDGFGQPRSLIERLSDGDPEKPGIYRYVISTKGFAPGDGTWRFVAEWHTPRPLGHDDAAITGKYRVRDDGAPQLP